MALYKAIDILKLADSKHTAALAVYGSVRGRQS